VKIKWNTITTEELAGLIGSRLEKHGIEGILVGGSCVTIYSKNKYVSEDLDYVTYASVKEIKPVLSKIGFEQKSSRHFEHPECPYFIEFLAPPVSIGEESPIKRFNKIKTAKGIIKLLTPTDCVKDRLAAYFHWNDPQSLEQAILVAKSRRINLKEIKRWSEKEKAGSKYRIFKNRL